MMSAQPVTAVPTRKSFAQVAAAANVPPRANEKAAKPPNQLVNPPKLDTTNTTGPGGNPSTPTPQILGRPRPTPAEPAIARSAVLDASSNDEHLSRIMGVANLGNGQQQSSLDTAHTKPSSDTKSVASRTTLTLDEKESLRPDDSASMQAAVDDDAFSPGGSAVANSKQDSDPDSRAFRDQFCEVDRTGSRNVAAQAGPAGDKVPPGEPIAVGEPGPISTVPGSFAPIPVTALEGQHAKVNAWNIPPDEKLVEALNSPKDRLFVLKIEQDMIDFVKDSKEEYLQLPQTNSFYRMLSHKLADYYLLGHVIDDSMTSVRIFRTSNCRLPPPLIGPNPAADGSTPPPTAPTRKIMRRNAAEGKMTEAGTGSDKNLDSLTSSKATSDVGASNSPDEVRETTNGTGDKLSMTREERENRYNAARARIFKDFEASENNENVQADKGISRTSSTSGVKKNKKSRKPKDDGFEARSAFDQYGQRIVPHDFVQSPPAEFAYDQYVAFRMPGQYPSGAPPFHSIQGGHMAQYNLGPDGYGQVPYNMWSAQPLLQGYTPGNNGMHHHFSTQSYQSVNGYDGSPYSAGNMASQATPKGNAPSLANFNQGYIPPNDSMHWAQNSFGSPYGLSQYGDVNGGHQGYYPTQGMQPANPPPSFAPYSSQQPHYYGQHTIYPNCTQAHFNPRSQNFVPGYQGGVMQAMSPEPGIGHSNNHPGFAAESSMQRQHSSASHGSNFNPGPMSQHNGANGRVNTGMQGPARHQAQNGRTQASAQNSITKWSTPANLPAKPPPPAVISPYVEVARDPENQQPLPPKPFSAVDHSSGSVKNLPIR